MISSNASSRLLTVRALTSTVGLCAALSLVACAGKGEDTSIGSETGATSCEVTWYIDFDGDGFGSDENTMLDCDQPSGTSDVGGDCDDNNPARHPDAEELCNDLDDNCNDEVDEGAKELFFEDLDGDGYGAGDGEEFCEFPGDGWVENDEDCDDEDIDVSPDGIEECNGYDDDCDEEVDEEGSTEWFLDDDGDGYGDDTVVLVQCDQPSGYVEEGGDCDDTTSAVNPGITDGCNGEDDDCDGDIDEDVKGGWMLVSIDTTDGYIYEIDPATANVTRLSEIQTEGVKINTMDVREDGTAIVHNAAETQLGSIDVCDGSVSGIGETGVGSMGGITFGPSGTLYGLDGSTDSLVSLDTNTGAATKIGPLAHNLGNSGMAYSCITDTVYGADANTNQIFEINLTTGRAQNFRSTSVRFNSVGLEFDHATGLLLASTGSDLYTIDPSTGATNQIGSMRAGNIDDLAFHPTCP